MSKNVPFLRELPYMLEHPMDPDSAWTHYVDALLPLFSIVDATYSENRNNFFTLVRNNSLF